MPPCPGRQPASCSVSRGRHYGQCRCLPRPGRDLRWPDNAIVHCHRNHPAGHTPGRIRRLEAPRGLLCDPARPMESIPQPTCATAVPMRIMLQLRVMHVEAGVAAVRPGFARIARPVGVAVLLNASGASCRIARDSPVNESRPYRTVPVRVVPTARPSSTPVAPQFRPSERMITPTGQCFLVVRSMSTSRHPDTTAPAWLCGCLRRCFHPKTVHLKKVRRQ